MTMVMVYCMSLCMCTLVQLLAVPQSPMYTSGILCQTDSQPSSLAHPVSELSTRAYLDKYLASAFNLALENGRLKVVDSQQFVLTLDYTLKVGRDCTQNRTYTSCAQHCNIVGGYCTMQPAPGHNCTYYNKWQFCRLSRSKTCMLLIEVSYANSFMAYKSIIAYNS